jgi:superfamily II DNA or RNA helicase
MEAGYLDLRPPRPSRDEIQAEAVEALLRERADPARRSTFLKMPTGTGKSRTACKYIKHGLTAWDGRFLVLAHMGELLDQFADELDAMNIPFVVEKAEQKALDKMLNIPSIRVCLGSKDSMQKRRLAEWPQTFFTDIFEDEAHFSTAPTWKNVHNHFSAFRIGMSATIDRLDGVPLSTVFETMAYDYPLLDAIDNGHRLDYRCVACDTQIDIRGIKANRAGELNPGEVEARLAPVLDKLANSIRQELRRLHINKAVAFLPDVFTAKALADVLTQVGVPAKAVHGDSSKHKMPDPLRRTILNQHKAGAFPVLTNAKLLGVGYNDPSIEAVIHLRPTTSRAAYDQMSGRCGRIFGDKRWAYLLYFGWESELDLIGPSDIYAERLDKRTRQIARRLLEKTKSDDPRKVIEQAEAVREMELEREREEADRKLRIKARKREIAYGRRQFDPLSAARAFSPALQCSPSDEVSHRQPVKPGQAAVLADLGITDVSGLSANTAQAAIEFWQDRDFRKMASVKQIALLKRMNVPEGRSMTMTSAEATRLFLEIRNNGQRKRSAAMA